jgi:hypothetical protein
MNDPDMAPVEPEDRRKHLDFIQATITRMSSASTTTKTWMMPGVTVTYGYSLTRNVRSIALLGIAAIILFAYLDANYLRQEKRFRRLYKSVAEGKNKVTLFSLNPDDLTLDGSGKSSEDWAQWMPRWINRLLPGPTVWASWSIGPFYLALIGIGVVVAIRDR